MIFFDLDGTLLDHKQSEYLGVKAFYKENLEYFNIDEDGFYKLWCKISQKNFKRYLDGEISFIQQRNERIKDIFSEADLQINDIEAEKKFQTYLINYEKSWKPYEDVIPCLRSLQNYRLGIISNGDYNQQLLKLERMGIKDFFEIIITAGDVGVAKPDIKIFEIASETAKECPENCYYVGDDYKTDILPCGQIGITGIWLNREKENHDISNIKMVYGLADLEKYLLFSNE